MRNFILHLLFLSWVFSQNYEIDNIRAVGHIPFDYCSDIWGYTSPNGHEFALVGRHNGTSIVDISSNPHEPVEVGYIPGASSIWRDLKVYGQYCYVTNETGGGLDIIDLADPFNPVKIGAYTATFTTAHNLFIADGYAYIFGANAGAGGCRILDLASDPEHPVEVGSWENTYFHDGYVKNDTLYGCGIYLGSLFIVNVSNKTNPVTMVEHNYSNYGCHAVWVTADSKYVITADEKSGGFINIFDIQNFNNINHVATWYPNEPQSSQKSVHNVYWKDDLLYMSYYVYGTRVVDISDKANPTEVGYYDFFPGQSGLYEGNWGTYPYAENGLIYSTDMSGNGFFVMSYPFLGEINFDLLNDTENTSSDIALNVSMDENMDYPLDYASLKLYWGMNGVITDSVTMNWVGTNEYSGNITPFGEEGILNYYVGVNTTDGQRLTKPYGAPFSTFSFHIGTDQIAPQVETVTQIEDQFYPHGSANIYTMATDNYGISAVELNWQVGDGAVHTTPCVATGNPNEFTAELMYNGIEPGNTIRYWSMATDASSAGNQTVSETKEFSITDNYILGNFEDVEKLNRWELGTWGRQFVNSLVGFTLNDSPGSQYEPNAENPCYLIEPLNLTYFDHAYFNFNSGEMFDEGDFGYLQVKRGGTEFWVTLLTVNGYNIMVDKYVNLDNYLDEEELYVRLLFTSDGQEESLGWFVDDIHLVLNQEMPIVGLSDEQQLPQQIELYSAYPNPFNPETTIQFQLFQTGHINLTVYDVRGREVRKLISDIQKPGMHNIKWNGKDNFGNTVSSGVYIYQLLTEKESFSGKIILMK